MTTKLTLFTKLTAGGLVAVAIALWTLWLSGDPGFGKFPPGPVVFIAVAAVVIWGARWWWTPILAALIALLVTSGWFARMPSGIMRLQHPGSVGKFAAGIFIGAVLQISALLLTDIAGLAATAQNFWRIRSTVDSVKMGCRFFGVIFVVMGVLMMGGGGHVDKYHNLMHLIWGILAIVFSFLNAAVAKRFCMTSGAFYLALAILGLVMGNPAMNRAWYFGPMLLNTGDHIFHLVLGSIFLAMGLISSRQWAHRTSHA